MRVLNSPRACTRLLEVLRRSEAANGLARAAEHGEGKSKGRVVAYYGDCKRGGAVGERKGYNGERSEEW